jgi:hypothetical protein
MFIDTLKYDSQNFRVKITLNNVIHKYHDHKNKSRKIWVNSLVKSFLSILFLISFFSVTSCGNDKTVSAVYSDSLILGTGNIGWNIEGESTSFINDTSTSGMTIYFKVESEEDLKGSYINLEIEKNTSDGYDQVLIHLCSNPSFTGHIIVSSFIHTFGQGQFRATARMLSNSKVIAVKEYSVTNK